MELKECYAEKDPSLYKSSTRDNTVSRIIQSQASAARQAGSAVLDPDALECISQSGLCLTSTIPPGQPPIQLSL